MKKPIMSEETEATVLDALSQFENRIKWNQWGLDTVRKQGSAILLKGPPGTGKTTIAEWMAKRRGCGFRHLDVAAIGGDGSPGSAEKTAGAFFEDARKRKNSTIFMDECDGLLQDRRGEVESSWQITTTEKIMTEIARYAGLVICATNLEEKLDPALDQRFLSIVEVGRPNEEMRLRLWKDKWPAKFPLQPAERELRHLAETFDLNGRQIENVIINLGSRCVRKKIKPNFALTEKFAASEVEKHVKNGK